MTSRIFMRASRSPWHTALSMSQSSTLKNHLPAVKSQSRVVYKEQRKTKDKGREIRCYNQGQVIRRVRINVIKDQKEQKLANQNSTIRRLSHRPFSRIRLTNLSFRTSHSFKVERTERRSRNSRASMLLFQSLNLTKSDQICRSWYRMRAQSSSRAL